jgi:hypothetical protein
MCACPKPVPGCSTSYMSCSFYDKNWRWNVIFRFVNISGICQSRVTNTWLEKWKNYRGNSLWNMTK